VASVRAQHIRSEAKFKPSCYFITVNLVVFIFPCKIVKGYLVTPPSVLWLSHEPWSSDDNFGQAPATVHFGPIIDSENGDVQSSTKLCRFAGTK
jgi:hypothetical protein